VGGTTIADGVLTVSVPEPVLYRLVWISPPVPVKANEPVLLSIWKVPLFPPSTHNARVVVAAPVPVYSNVEPLMTAREAADDPMLLVPESAIAAACTVPAVTGRLRPSRYCQR